MPLHIIILAAGSGKRMMSDLPKALHTLAGQPLLHRVLDTAVTLKPAGIHIIVGVGAEQVQAACRDYQVEFIEQPEPLGTGHAVSLALPSIPKEANVLVISADVPLTSYETLSQLQTSQQSRGLVLLTADFSDPSGLGRIIRNADNQIAGIIEQKDATPEQQTITEIYSGIMLVRASDLTRWLPKLNNENAQKEYYLTKIVQMAVEEKLPITSVITENNIEVMGVNTQAQLAQLERFFQLAQANALLEKGVCLRDPTRLDVRGDLQVGVDVEIDVNALFIGSVELGDHCRIGPNCVLKNVTLGTHVVVEANTVIENAVIGDHCQLGPFARIRPGTELSEHVKVGNFVEIKKVFIGAHSKVNHLSYIGDTLIGDSVNVGAGTITCNYDGVTKHQTIIESGAFIGSDTQLVAPVTVGANAVIGAGTTLTKNAPADKLTLARAEQRTIEGWCRQGEN